MIPYFVEDDFGEHWITDEGIIPTDLTLYYQEVQRIAWPHLEGNMWVDLYTPGMEHPLTMHVESHYWTQILGDIRQAMDAMIHDRYYFSVMTVRVTYMPPPLPIEPPPPTPPPHEELIPDEPADVPEEELDLGVDGEGYESDDEEPEMGEYDEGDDEADEEEEDPEEEPHEDRIDDVNVEAMQEIL